MSLIPNLFSRAALGVVLAGSTLFVVCVAAAAIGWSTGEAVSVPFVFDVRVAEENGVPAVSFVPHFTGMLVVGLLITALSMSTYLMRARPTANA